MKSDYLNKMVLLLFVAAAFFVASCTPEDNNDINGSNNDNSSSLTEESIVGKKFYTNKLCGFDRWSQSEIRFASNNTAYLTLITTHYDSGQEDRWSPPKASFNLDYPNVVFETEDGYYISATFTDNNLLVFGERDLSDIEEEFIAMHMYQYTPAYWSANGWHFRTNPQTITGPYAGQRFVNGSNKITFGVHCAGVNACFAELVDPDSPMGNWSGTIELWAGSLTVNYPNFIIGTDSWSVEGYFVDANTIVVTDATKDSRHVSINYTFTRG